ncbi:alpha/beta hydrolase family protein [Streptosporangium amethystogenes subsp. fukuiense]|uniref:Alpha/beta hydrolase family protein n=1 Tax=Streptosporangium amethystogenes subsp. fukuiense TaxID=698418 RepID=A0ABW2SU53_9ACTN
MPISTTSTRRIRAGLVAAALTVATALTPSAALANGAAVSTASTASTLTSPSWVGQYETQIGNDPATVYYPAAQTPLPVALLLQGANVPRESYSEFAKIVAGFGFAVAVPNHQRAVGPISGLFPEQSQTNAAVTWAAAENTRAGSPVAGRLDANRLVLLGHSFGGAAGLFAIGNTCTVPFCFGPVYQRPAALRAAVFYGASTTTPGGGAVPIANAGVPVALVQGGLDGNNLPAAALATYNGLGAAPKALVTVTGANHFGLTDTQTPAGAVPDATPQTLTQQESIDAAAKWSGLFLRASLGDTLAAAYVYGFGDASDPKVTVISQR